MQMLYQWELGGNTPEQVGASFFLERKAASEVESFARELFRGAVNDIETARPVDPRARGKLAVGTHGGRRSKHPSGGRLRIASLPGNSSPCRNQRGARNRAPLFRRRFRRVRQWNPGHHPEDPSRPRNQILKSKYNTVSCLRHFPPPTSLPHPALRAWPGGSAGRCARGPAGGLPGSCCRWRGAGPRE